MDKIDAKSIAELQEFAELKNRYFKTSKKGKGVYLIDLMAKDIIKENDIKTIFSRKFEDTWYYDASTGLWLPTARKLIKMKVEKMLGEICRTNPVNEVFEKIKRMTGIDKAEFESPDNLLCLNNGVLDVVNKNLLPFDKKYNFKTKLDVDFVKDADCPKIKEFLAETFYEEDIPLIQEWIGFHLYKRYLIKKSVIMFGQKNTGKTIFLKLLTKFIGEKNKTGISLHDISNGGKFVLAFLKDKLANIYDDLSSSDIQDEGGFKIACGGGYITAEEKFGDTFEFLNYAKNTFATNKIPSLNKEHDDAYYLRWLPIPCDNEVKEDKQNIFLIDTLTTKEELSGLLNFALEGLHRILKNERFSYNKTVEETKILMERHSNHLFAFIQDCLEMREHGKISTEEMYKIYQNYAIEKNYKLLSKSDLGRRLDKFATYISQKRDKERYWINVGLKREADKKLLRAIRELKGGENIDTLDTFLEHTSIYK